MFEKYLYCTVVGERPHDDLPCSECEAFGPIVIVDPKVGKQADLCRACLEKVQQMEREDSERSLQDFVREI